MVKRNRQRRAPNPNSKSTPIAFRLDRALIARMDATAEKLNVKRNRLAVLVFQTYFVERGDSEIERIVKEADDRARPNLFA